MIINSPAKLNLYLDIINKRPDGYHNIKTVFERISLFDKIILKARKDRRIRIVCRDLRLPKGAANLAYQAALLLKNDFKGSGGVDIEIKKRIPLGAGLGGGSSNAACVLLGLNRLWRLKLSRKVLLKYAKALGSDVAFFLSDAAFALGLGRGEQIRPLADLNKRLWHIIVVPRLKVMTKEIYQGWDSLTKGHRGISLSSAWLVERIRKLPGGILFNSLEEVTFKKYPQVKMLKEKLIRLGLKSVLMSGSGSAVFGIVKSRKEGLRLAEFLRRYKGLKVFVVRTT